MPTLLPNFYRIISYYLFMYPNRAFSSKYRWQIFDSENDAIMTRKVESFFLNAAPDGSCAGYANGLFEAEAALVKGAAHDDTHDPAIENAPEPRDVGERRHAARCDHRHACMLSECSD